MREAVVVGLIASSIGAVSSGRGSGSGSGVAVGVGISRLLFGLFERCVCCVIQEKSVDVGRGGRSDFWFFVESDFFSKSLSDPVLYRFPPNFCLITEGERERGGVGRSREDLSAVGCTVSWSDRDWSSL